MGSCRHASTASRPSAALIVRWLFSSRLQRVAHTTPGSSSTKKTVRAAGHHCHARPVNVPPRGRHSGWALSVEILWVNAAGRVHLGAGANRRA
jgi:hypothetical protein